MASAHAEAVEGAHAEEEEEGLRARTPLRATMSCEPEPIEELAAREGTRGNREGPEQPLDDGGCMCII